MLKHDVNLRYKQYMRWPLIAMPCDAVMPGTKLQEHSGSEKAWVYTTVDFADEEQKPELFCIRFASPESEIPAALALPAACGGHSCLPSQHVPSPAPPSGC